jgi:4-hydroxy-tetrahydrodipicolinate synthase
MTALYVDIWNRMEAGDRNSAWRIFTHILPLIRFELQPGMGVSAMKHNLVEAGVIRSSRVRHPTASLGARSLEELRFLREWVASAHQAARA